MDVQCKYYRRYHCQDTDERVDRMPHIITDFFSRRMYNGEFSRLERSEGSWRACRFVDVAPPRKSKKGPNDQITVRI